MSLKWNTRWLKPTMRVLSVAAGLAVLVTAIAWLSGMFEEKIEPAAVRRVRAADSDLPTDVIHEITKPYVEEAIGTFKASSRTIVSAKVLATIDEILVAAGDQVDKGDTLIRLDDQEYRTRLRQAERALEAATANRQEAEKRFERVERLAEQNAASRSEYDQAARDVQVTIAEEARARQAMSEAEVLLSYTVIRAAKNGRIVDRFAEPGDIAQPGEPILVLYDATSLRLEAPVMEQLAVKLRPGDTLSVSVDALQREYEATIDEIVPQADAPSRSFLVKASLPKSIDLYEGMFGRLKIPAGERRHLCIATGAVLRIGQLEFVDILLPDGSIERRLIKTGRLGMPGRQEVLSGVEAGDEVILHQTAGTPEDEYDVRSP
jgi:RND family efflux transporter MFP subunit